MFVKKIFIGALSAITLWAPQIMAQESRTSAGGENKSGLMIEPGLTGEVSSSKINYPAPLSDSSGSVNGYGVSARLAYDFSDTIFAGVDGRYSRPTFTDSSGNTSSTANEYNVGPVLGVQTPVVGLRVWGTYVPWATLDPNEVKGIKVNFANGNGYRLGAGFRISSVSVNLEYQSLNYGVTNVSKVGPFNTNLNFNSVQLSNQSYLLGVSFPITI